MDSILILVFGYSEVKPKQQWLKMKAVGALRQNEVQGTGIHC